MPNTADSKVAPDDGATPAFSVVISVQNRLEDLIDCLRALGLQAWPLHDFEVVVIDNCSRVDLSPAFDHARHEFGLRLTTERTAVDGGPAPARNRGVAIASGRIIAFTDSDCRPGPKWLAAAAAAFEADAALGLVCGPVLPKPEHKVHLTSKLTFIAATEHPTYPTANLLLRRSLFLAHGGFDTSLSYKDPLGRAVECADTDLAWRIIKSGAGKRFVEQAVVYHSIERQSLPMWLLEGTRLFPLPELVRRHPELRQRLLSARWFFYPRAWLILVSCAVLLAVLVAKPILLPVLLVALLAAGAWRKRSLSPAVLFRFAANAMLQAARMSVMELTLLYGSVRFRCLVL